MYLFVVVKPTCSSLLSELEKFSCTLNSMVKPYKSIWIIFMEIYISFNYENHYTNDFNSLSSIQNFVTVKNLSVEQRIVGVCILCTGTFNAQAKSHVKVSLCLVAIVRRAVTFVILTSNGSVRDWLKYQSPSGDANNAKTKWFIFFFFVSFVVTNRVVVK